MMAINKNIEANNLNNLYKNRLYLNLKQNNNKILVHDSARRMKYVEKNNKNNNTYKTIINW